MYLIVGLGNPEEEYSNTRHNIGFDVVNELAKKYDININKSKFKGLVGSGNIEDEKVIILKPQTFMNLSGESIREAIDFYKISTQNMIVIYDDIDIEPGKVRTRESGGPGTHKGMISIINHLNSEDFPRIRVGIGKPVFETHLVEHVISPIKKEDKEILNQGIDIAVKSIVEILKNDIKSAMNKYNK